MNIEYITRGTRVMAKCRIGNKVYFGVGDSKESAHQDLILSKQKDTFALFDMDAYTSMHNSSVRTRV